MKSIGETKNMDVVLRKVNLADALLFFRWANDEDVRNNAIKKEKISLDSHLQWFEKKLQSTSVLLVLEVKGLPAGQIRFDQEKTGGWLIDYSIDKTYRGKGLGKLIVDKGARHLNKYPIIALVKPENIQSIKIFESLNFHNAGLTRHEGSELLKFVKDHN